MISKKIILVISRNKNQRKPANLIDMNKIAKFFVYVALFNFISSNLWHSFWFSPYPPKGWEVDLLDKNFNLQK